MTKVVDKKKTRANMVKRIFGIDVCKNASTPVCFKKVGARWKERVPDGRGSDSFVDSLQEHPDVQAFFTQEFQEHQYVIVRTKEAYFYERKRAQRGIFTPLAKKGILPDGTIVEKE